MDITELLSCWKIHHFKDIPPIMPPRKGQTRSRTGPSSSIRTGSRVTKPTRSASERTAKSEQAISDSINSSDIHENHIQVPSTPPPPPASTSKEPYTPVSSRTTKTQPGTNSNAQNKGERRGVASPMTPLSPAKTPDLAPSTQTTSAINAQAKAEAKVKYDIDDEALRMPEAQVKRYWRNIEESRITPQGECYHLFQL